MFDILGINLSLITASIKGLSLIKCLECLKSNLMMDALTIIPALQSSIVNGRFSSMIRRLNPFSLMHFPVTVSPISRSVFACVLCNRTFVSPILETQ